MHDAEPVVPGLDTCSLICDVGQIDLCLPNLKYSR